jgi:phosphatidylserine/phosphatidylglycerophosphate/cardiolipin synthase-like enzyme
MRAMDVRQKPQVAVFHRAQIPSGQSRVDGGAHAPSKNVDASKSEGVVDRGALKKVVGDDERDSKSTLGAGAAQALHGLSSTEPKKKGTWRAALATALVGIQLLGGCALNLPQGVDPNTTVAVRGAVTLPQTTGPPTSVLQTQIGQLSTNATSTQQTHKSLSATFDSLKTIGGGPVQARLLSNGLDAWNARWEHLETAKTSIDASYFIFEKDPFGYAYLGFLTKKQMEGVHVRVMTDAMADTFGKHGFKMPGKGKDYLQELVNQGGEAFIYHPIWQRPLDALKLDFAVLASNHDKIQVVDGEKSITGGRNIAKDYFADPADLKAAWRDIDLSMEGAGAAAALTKAFNAEVGHSFTRPVHKDRLGNWTRRDVELVGAYAMMDTWLKDKPLSDAEKAAVRADPAKQQALVDELVNKTLQRLPNDLPKGHVRAPNKREMEFLRHNASELVQHLEARGSRATFEQNRTGLHASESKILDQTSVAGERKNDFAESMTKLILSAKDHVVIENPYVVLTEDMVKAMEQAAKRGVRIDIITNSPLSTDSDVTQAFFLEDWPYILARVPTAHIYVITGERKFHGKSAVMDGEVSLVTTYNLDLLSGYVNSEVGAAVKSKDFAKDLLAAFEKDKADPKNGVLEYTIQKDETGKAVLNDGKPIPTFGPEDHLPQKILEEYAGKRKLWGHTLRDNLPYFAPLRHPGLTDSGGD